jgi:hypothetical protein
LSKYKNNELTITMYKFIYYGPGAVLAKGRRWRRFGFYDRGTRRPLEESKTEWETGRGRHDPQTLGRHDSQHPLGVTWTQQNNMFSKISSVLCARSEIKAKKYITASGIENFLLREMMVAETHRTLPDLDRDHRD